MSFAPTALVYLKVSDTGSDLSSGVMVEAIRRAISEISSSQLSNHLTPFRFGNYSNAPLISAKPTTMNIGTKITLNQFPRNKDEKSEIRPAKSIIIPVPNIIIKADKDMLVLFSARAQDRLGMITYLLDTAKT